MQRRMLFATICLATGVAASAEQIHRQAFEGKQTSLRLGLTNGEIKLLEHDLSHAQVHSGSQAERMVVRATSGSFCFVEYSVPPAMLIEELSISTYINASRPGATLVARIVLPREIDEETKKPKTTLVRGDRLDVANRWRRLEVRRPDLLLQQQQQLLQAQLKRPVDVREAYVDLVLIDVFSGVGDLELFVDDIHFGPIVSPNGAKTEEPPGAGADPVPLALRDEEGNKPNARMPEVRDRNEKNRSSIVGEQLRVGDRPFFLHGIRWTEAPLERIRESGFNTAFVEWPVSPAIAEQAAKLGLQLVGMIGERADRPLVNVANGEAAKGEAASAPMPAEDSALGFFVGGDLERRNEPGVAAAADAVRTRARSRPILADAVENLRAYSRIVDMLGVYRYPLMTTLDLPTYQQFLTDRRRLARPGTYMWTWIQTHPPEDYVRLVFGKSLGEEFTGPVGPQPEQIRLLAYAALAAGCRGLAFSSDRAYSTSLAGRDRILQTALFGLELKLIATFIAEGDAPVAARTSDPRIAAVSIGHKRASLVIVYWKDRESQYVVGQSAAKDLHVVVENAAEAAQCLHVGLAEVHTLKRRKGLGGVQITVPEFDTVSLMVLTSDAALAAQFQELVQQMSPQAATWQKELAEITVSKTEQIAGRLQQSGGTRLGNTAAILAEARKYLDGCRIAFDQRNYRVAYLQGERARRSARLVQKNLWKEQVGELASPVADPFAVSFYTLPESKQFRASLEQANWGRNRLPTGDFEVEGNLERDGWSYFEHCGQELRGSAMLVGENPKTGSRCLELRIAAPEGIDAPAVVENSLVELVSPALQVEPGQVVRIRGSVRLPRPPTGTDGAMVWDSLGGETLALRFVEAGPWRDFVLYRPVNRSGQLRLHLVMTGMGVAHFDNLAIEAAENANVPLAGQMDRPSLR